MCNMAIDSEVCICLFHLTYNKALLDNWCWRLVTLSESLWKQVITLKFKQEGIKGCEMVLG